MQRISRQSGGFTLLEILVSMLLLAVTLVGGMALYHNAEQIMALMVHKKVAMELANEKMEDIRNTSFSRLAAQEDYPRVSGLSGVRSAEVFELSPDLKEVRVTVRWDEAGQTGDRRKVELVSYVAK